MKFFLLISLLFFVFTTNIYAQTPVVTIPIPSSIPNPINPTTGIPIPGVGCGNPDPLINSQVPGANKCCKYEDIRSNDIYSDALNLAATYLPFPLNAFFWIPNSLNQATRSIKRSIQPPACPYGYPSTPDPNDPSCTCSTTKPGVSPTPLQALIDMCNKYFAGSSELGACTGCAGKGQIYTGIACFDTNLSSFIQNSLFNIGIGLAGIFAFLCILYAAFQLQTSRGNPEKIKKAQELLTSCIMGLMLIIFSVFILKLIGVDILQIPGFGK